MIAPKKTLYVLTDDLCEYAVADLKFFEWADGKATDIDTKIFLSAPSLLRLVRQYREDMRRFIANDMGNVERWQSTIQQIDAVLNPKGK